jgi:excisionase family DNA binding protein
MTSPFLTVQECSEYLRVRPQTLYDWVYRNKIPFRKHGSRLLFHRDEVNEWSASEKGCSTTSISKFKEVKERLRSLKTDLTVCHSESLKQKETG